MIKYYRHKITKTVYVVMHDTIFSVHPTRPKERRIRESNMFLYGGLRWVEYTANGAIVPLEKPSQAVQKIATAKYRELEREKAAGNSELNQGGNTGAKPGIQAESKLELLRFYKGHVDLCLKLSREDSVIIPKSFEEWYEYEYKKMIEMAGQ